MFAQQTKGDHTVSGDSHTNFDAGAFTVGALGGAATIAGALGAGLANLRAAQARRWESWTVTQLIAALELSEALRENDHRIKRARSITIARLRSQRAIERAHCLQRS
jgi:hypothetical protein